MALVLVLGFFSTPLSAPRAAAQFPPAPGTGPGLAETIEAIDSAAVTTRILYVTAHPDDESAAILTYLARGLHADVALLSLTRGEGGQNALGPEQAPQLGLIRTQELLAATRGYGVKLYFTRAKDFGFSKTPEETEKVWGDQVLEDMVRVIRTFRPNIVINNLIGGHGHHVAAGKLTPKAVQLAADPTAYQDMLHEVGSLTAWGEVGSAVRVLNVDRGARKPNAYVVPVDEISPLYGKSYREIGLDAFTNHRTQGITNFINSPFLLQPLALVAESGEPFNPEILHEPLEAWKGPPILALIAGKVEKAVHSAHDAALALDWSTAAKELTVALSAVNTTTPVKYPTTTLEVPVARISFDVGREEEKLNRALALVAGLKVTADADRSDLVAGENLSIKITARCRVEIHCEFGTSKLGRPLVSEPPVLVEAKHVQDVVGQTQITASVLQPSAPPDPNEAILPEASPLAAIYQETTIFGYKLSFEQIVTHVTATTTKAERVPLRIVPAYTLAVEPKQAIEVLPNERKPFDVLLRVHSYATKREK